MSEATHEEAHTGPIKTPNQLLWWSLFAFVVPVFIIIGLVAYVTSANKTAPGAVDEEIKIAERIQKVRRQCAVLVTIGACATAGGIQALRNWSDKDEYVRAVYARPDFIQTLKMSTPIAEHVPVDFELRGCPINKKHLIELISATLAGRKPNIPTHSLCMKCKRSGNVCITIARGVPCLGPVTQSGCGALCPRFGRGCYGCYGPAESANTAAMTRMLRELGQKDEEIARLFRTFNAWAWQFRQASEEAERA